MLSLQLKADMGKIIDFILSFITDEAIFCFLK